MLLKCCTQHVSKFGKLSSGHKIEKGQFSFPTQRRAMPKNVQTTIWLHSFHMLASLCSNSTWGFNSAWIENFHMKKLCLEKTEEPQIILPIFIGSWKKQGNYKNPSTSASLTTLKLLTVWTTTNSGKFFKRWEYQTTLPVSWETCMWVKKQQLEPDIKKLTGSKLGKEYNKAVYCYSAYLTCKQSTSCEILGWINHN